MTTRIVNPNAFYKAFTLEKDSPDAIIVSDGEKAFLRFDKIKIEYDNDRKETIVEYYWKGLLVFTQGVASLEPSKDVIHLSGFTAKMEITVSCY